MNRRLVVFLGPEWACETAASTLDGMAEVVHAANAAAVDQALPDAVAILDASMATQFTSARLALASQLRVFVTATTGADHVDQAALSARNIPLLTLRDRQAVTQNITAAAEHSWLLLMACARRLPPALDHVRSGGWDRTQFPGLMLRGKTLGVIGCGRIGTWVATYAAAFGMRCIGYDPHRPDLASWIEPVPLRVLLGQSDFVSVHVPLQPETHTLLSRDAFQRMKAGAILINTSRGEVLDETALLAALTTGDLAAAALDVIVGEPKIEGNPLLEYARTHDNLLITPHIGGFSPDAVNIVVADAAQRIATFLGSEPGLG